MQLAPYPFDSANPNLVQQMNTLQGPWVGLFSWGNYPYKPKRMSERRERCFRRLHLCDHLKITTWWAQKESSSGGYTCSALVEYAGGGGYYATKKGRATGGNYCKESGAVAEALAKLGPNFDIFLRLHGTGMSSVERVLKFLGWEHAYYDTIGCFSRKGKGCASLG